ncbi:MAG: DUF2804 domain-containing protein [Treponema sp.]|nr:DUF2804 domain-containing protein [Treponema sp.]
MYTREILAPRGSPIEYGVPLPGTWNKAFTRVDLLEINKPYPVPLPRWLKDYRIKEWESFSIQDDHFLLEALLGNLKLYQIAFIFLFDKESGEKYVYRKLIPGNSLKMPNKLAHGSVECRSPHFFFRVHTWLNADTIKLDLDIAATKKQPALTAHFAFNIGSRDVTPLAVSLNFTDNRNMYAFKSLTSVRGDIELGEKHHSLNPARCSGLFRDYKGFYPYRMLGVFCGGMGFDGEDKRYGFHIVENQARDNRKNNENALWVDGRLTPLPPVKITMPNGQESDWVIQDLDGMIDLVFTPHEFTKYGSNLLAVNSDFFFAMGYYNGMVVSAKEDQIQVKNQLGIGEKLYIRV